MAEIPFKLYPRGFLGARLEGRIEKQSHVRDSVLAGLRLDRIAQFGNQNNIDHSNADVEALYAQYIKRTAATLAFEFREKLLIVALNAFGTSQFDFWFEMQLKSPVAGDYHRRFLDDTLRFINTGRRDMALETWQALVTSQDHGDHNSQMSDFAREFFGRPIGGWHSPRNTNLIDVVQQWCSQPNGFEDLLGTLHLLFGNE